MTPEPEPLPVGARAKAADPKLMRQLRGLRGRTHGQVASELGVHRVTLQRWLREYPWVREALS